MKIDEPSSLRTTSARWMHQNDHLQPAARASDASRADEYVCTRMCLTHLSEQSVDPREQLDLPAAAPNCSYTRANLSPRNPPPSTPSAHEAGTELDQHRPVRQFVAALPPGMKIDRAAHGRRPDPDQVAPAGRPSSEPGTPCCPAISHPLISRPRELTARPCTDPPGRTPMPDAPVADGPDTK